MAFTIRGRQIIVTAADPNPIWKTGIKIKDLYWENPANIGDLANLKEGNGDMFRQLRCEVANESQFTLVENWLNGIIVDVLASGTLVITFE